MTLNGVALQKEVIVKRFTGSTIVVCFWDLKEHLDMKTAITSRAAFKKQMVTGITRKLQKRIDFSYPVLQTLLNPALVHCSMNRTNLRVTPVCKTVNIKHYVNTGSNFSIF